MLLQDLDPVAVGVLHEAEARHQRAIPKEFLDRSRRKALRREARVFSGQVVNCDRQMAVAVAVAVAVGLAATPSQRSADSLDTSTSGVAELTQPLAKRARQIAP